MWVIVGPFDGEVVGDVAFQKHKLLKPNTSYTVGRKDRPLLINNKKISHGHCDFIVGKHTADDARDPTIRPSLEIFNNNKKGKPLRITRRDETEDIVEVDAKLQLEDSDQVSLISGIIVRVQWTPVCAYSSPSGVKTSISIEVCASLGIKLVHTLQDNVTHHLATHYVANLSMTTSLLALSRIVKPEWLVEVLRLGNLPRNNEQSNGTSLEDHFVLPQETKFRPSFSPSLMPSQKAFDIWEPNEERVDFFRPLRFICLHEKVTQLDSELREAIHRGKGNLETFDIHSGVPKFHKTLTRSQAKEGKRTIVVGDIDAMQTAIGKTDWAQFVAEARSFASDILSPSKIVQSVLDVNFVLLQSSAMDTDGGANNAPTSSPLPERVPNSLPNELSVQPDSSSQTTAPRRRLLRRAASRSASQEAPAPPAISEPPAESQEPSSRPRRLLTRRVAGGQPLVTGLDDPSSVLDRIPDLRDADSRRSSPPPSAPTTRTAPTPARKLKRRVGAAGLDALLASDSHTLMSGMEETIGEPPLKKFKALFEASNPGGPGAESLELVGNMPHSQTQTQTETQSRSDRPSRSIGASSLAILQEEEEETQSGHGHTANTQQRRAKRTLESVEEDDVMDVDGNEGASLPATKKRAVENVNAVVGTNSKTGAPTSKAAGNKPPSMVAQANDKQGGAPAGKLDTDAAFLKAIASTKRGKKTEDAFDREFNKLKISKPTIEEHDPEEEWAVLADFGDDSGLRGNFMVVVEMELHDKGASAQQRGLPNDTWDGKPNFKKFKQKVAGTPRAKVELFISDENDYGMGSAYWKGGNSQAPTQTHNAFAESQMESQVTFDSQPQASKKSQKSRSQPIAESDDDEPVAPLRKSRKPPSGSGTAALTTKRATTRGKAPAKAQPLFLDSDDEDEHQAVVAEVDEEQTLRSTAETKVPTGRQSTRTVKAPKKPLPAIADDDSDDGVFKGFKGRKGGR